jgi:hypothetical protein
VLIAESAKRISSRNTFFMKRIFPLLWFGLIALFVIIALTASEHAKRGTPPAVFFVIPVVMVIVGYLVMRRLVFDLADEVYDEATRCACALAVTRNASRWITSSTSATRA